MIDTALEQVWSNPPPLVTVALPVYNAGKHLRLAVLSIVRQTFTNWELLLIDDGSTDNAVQDITDINDVRIRISRDGENHGLAARLNEAIDMARGSYFARMDSDDVSYPERFARQVAALQNDPNLDLVATRAITIDENDQVTGLFPYARSHGEICSQPWRGFHFPHPTWMGRIEWFRNHRYTVPAPYLCEDQELLLRTYRYSKFATSHEILFAYRIRSKVDWHKLARTRRAVFVFQLRYFSSLKQWHFILLAAATFVAKMSSDLAKRCLGGTIYPGHGVLADAVVHEWRNVLDRLAAESRVP